MSIIIDQSALKHTVERIDYLFYGFSFFVILGLLGELFLGSLGLSFFFWGPLMALSLKSFRQVLVNFQYSFWSFTLGISLYFFFTIAETNSSVVINCYSIAFILLVILCLIVSSPLFYPRITWWEYDFRFRGELKIHAHGKDLKTSGRLNDLRREAGCIILFEKLELGTEFFIDYQKSGEINSYPVKIMSRRSSTQGRGYTYGVKFLFSQHADLERFKSLSNLWKVTKKARRQAKFQNAS